MAIDPTRTVGYYRVSTEKQADTGKALERYREDLIAFGVLPENLYFDVASGGDTEREGFNSVLAACRGWADTIAIPDLTRFQRSVAIWENVRPELIRLNIRIFDVYANREIDFRTAEGIRMTQLETVQAEYYRNYAAQGALRGQERRRRQKKPSVAPFGYLVVKDALIINNNPYKDTGKTYREIALEYIDLFLKEGKLITTVAKFCKRYGYERIGRGFEDFPRDRSCLRRWLINPALRGHQAYYQRRDNRRKSAFKGESTEPRIHYNNHEALISPETGREIDRLLSLCRRGAAPGRPINPLIGLVFCSGCGGAMRTKGLGSKAKPYHYLICSNAHPPAGKDKTCYRTSTYGVQVHHAVSAVIGKIVTRSREIAEWGADGLTPVGTEDPEVKELRNQIATLEALNMPDLVPIIEEKRAKVAALFERERDELFDKGEIIKQMRSVAGRAEFWRSLSVSEQKRWFPRFVERVTVDRGQISVFLRC